MKLGDRLNCKSADKRERLYNKEQAAESFEVLIEENPTSLHPHPQQCKQV
jgi:hypothetical protein